EPRGLVRYHTRARGRAVYERHLTEEFAGTQDGDRDHGTAVLARDPHGAIVDQEDGAQRYVLLENNLIPGKRLHRGRSQQRALLGWVEEGKKLRGCRRHLRELHGPG